MHYVDLMEYSKIFSELFFVLVSLIFVLNESTLFHPELDAVAVKDQIELLVFDELRSYFEDGGYFGKKILPNGSKYKFAYSDLAALMFVYLHALDCK